MRSLLPLSRQATPAAVSYTHLDVYKRQLRDIEHDYAEFNEERTAFYQEQELNPVPASTGIQAILCRPELLIEIEAIAMFKKVDR